MRLTRAGEYAVRCALFLSLRGKGVLCTRKEIARTMDIPDQFLGKIAQQMARAGILEIIQGAKGGYRLIVPPSQLTMLQVVESVIGEIYLNDCIVNPDACGRIPGCEVHKVWDRARTQLRDTLRKARFSRLVSGDSCLAEMAAATETKAKKTGKK